MSYDQEFEQAMKVKLERSRQAKGLQTSEVSQKDRGPSEQKDAASFREQAISETLANHPRLTREKVIQGMEEMGF